MQQNRRVRIQTEFQISDLSCVTLACELVPKYAAAMKAALALEGA